MPKEKLIQYISLFHLLYIVLIFIMGVMVSFVVVLFLWERGQNKGFFFWLKDVLILKKGEVVFMFLKRAIMFWTSSRAV